MSEDTTKVEVDTEVEQEEDTTHGSDVNVETLNVQKRKALEQRDEARKLAEERLAKIKELEGLVSQETPEPSKDKPKDTPEYVSKQELEIVKFTIAHKDLEQDDIDELMALSKGKNISLEDAYKLPIFQTYFEKQKEERAVKNAIPNSNRSSSVQPEKPISEMSEEEHRAYYQKVTGRS